jgi:hypothetical protein
VFSRTYLTYVRAAERVQRVWLHPGQQLHITDFNHYNILDPGFRRGDDEFFINLLMPSFMMSWRCNIFYFE